MLSPYIRHRVLSEERVCADIVSAARVVHGDATKFLEEVVWRTYWKGFLEQRPSLWDGDLCDEERLKSALSPSQSKLYDRAIRGESGIGCFDSWVQELLDVGYLHNHARMWFASIWIFTLQLPWKLGALFFMRHLLDGDPASNTLSWRWVAGLHTPGKTYLATAENILKNTAGRFGPKDVEGLCSVARASVDTQEYPLVALRPLPPPGESSSRARLIFEDDLEIGDSVSREPDLLVVSPVAYRNPYSADVLGWKNALIADRAEAWRREGRRVLIIESVRALRETMGTNAPGPVAFLEPPVGYARDFVRGIEPLFGDSGFVFQAERRSWDSRFFPEAKAGFFQFRKKVLPALIASLPTTSPV